MENGEREFLAKIVELSKEVRRGAVYSEYVKKVEAKYPLSEETVDFGRKLALNPPEGCKALPKVYYELACLLYAVKVKEKTPPPETELFKCVGFDVDDLLFVRRIVRRTIRKLMKHYPIPTDNKPKEPIECYVCLRITPEDTLKLAHKIWSDNPQIAREIGLKASKIINECYKKKPIFFCSLSQKGILSGLFYLLGIQHGARKTARELRHATGSTEPTVRASYYRWLHSFPELFPEFKIESVKTKRKLPFQSERYRLIFKGKPVWV